MGYIKGKKIFQNKKDAKSFLYIFFVSILILFSCLLNIYSQRTDIKLEQISIRQGLSNNRVEAICQDSKGEELTIHRTLLYKKIIALTGEPPVELIRRARLNKAAKLIEHKSGNISEIAFEVGFNNPSYFTECFRKQFGINPLQYHKVITKDKSKRYF